MAARVCAAGRRLLARGRARRRRAAHAAPAVLRRPEDVALAALGEVEPGQLEPVGRGGDGIGGEGDG